MCFDKGGVKYENDIPAEKEVEGKGPWLPEKNEYSEWQEGIVR